MLIVPTTCVTMHGSTWEWMPKLACLCINWMCFAVLFILGFFLCPAKSGVYPISSSWYCDRNPVARVASTPQSPGCRGGRHGCQFLYQVYATAPKTGTHISRTCCQDIKSSYCFYPYPIHLLTGECLLSLLSILKWFYPTGSRRVSNLQKNPQTEHCLTEGIFSWNQWARLFGHKGIESLWFLEGHLTGFSMWILSNIMWMLFGIPCLPNLLGNVFTNCWVS